MTSAISTPRDAICSNSGWAGRLLLLFRFLASAMVYAASVPPQPVSINDPRSAPANGAICEEFTAADLTCPLLKPGLGDTSAFDAGAGLSRGRASPAPQ